MLLDSVTKLPTCQVLSTKYKKQSQEFVPLNYNQMIYSIMKEPSLRSEDLGIIKSIWIGKMLPSNNIILASGINYHSSPYLFCGSSANYSTIVYRKMCLSMQELNQGTLSR